MEPFPPFPKGALGWPEGVLLCPLASLRGGENLAEIAAVRGDMIGGGLRMLFDRGLLLEKFEGDTVCGDGSRGGVVGSWGGVPTFAGDLAEIYKEVKH